MPSKFPIYWDSCVFLDRLRRHPDRIALLENITNGAAEGDILVVTSAVTKAEVIKLPELGLTPDEEVKTIADFFENPWINFRLVDPFVAEMAAKLRRDHGLKTCDSITRPRRFVLISPFCIRMMVDYLVSIIHSGFQVVRVSCGLNRQAIPDLQNLPQNRPCRDSAWVHAILKYRR